MVNRLVTLGFWILILSESWLHGVVVHEILITDYTYYVILL